MRTAVSSILLVILGCTPRQPDQVPNYDVCVYGGTSAGVIAAYTAAKMGKSVVLIEPGRNLGGLSSGGLGFTDIGNKYAITGLSLDFYRKIGKHYGKFEQWVFEPHVAEELFNDYIKSANIPVLFEHRIVKAEKKNSFITQIAMEDTTGATKSIAARMFIDCSYEGDLMARAGVSYAVGRESNQTYNETYNGVQLLEGHQVPDGINPWRVPGDTASGLLWGIDKSALEPAGSGDKRVQAYNYRICLTDNPANRVDISRPDGYDSTRYELLVRLFKVQPDKRSLNDYFIWSRMPNRKTDINNRGGFSTDMIGMNHDYPEAGPSERTAIVRRHEVYTKGLLYFFGHDPRVPGELRKEMLQWGYPRDEYVGNANWSPQLYIRESRRMTGSYVMTQANCQGREIVTDGVGMAAYTMDSHNCRRLVVAGMVKNEGNVEIGGFGPYPISYRAIIPRETESKNLFVPVCLSASHIAYGSIRMEPVFMVLAQSAAVAACMAIDAGQSVQQVDVKKVQDFLKQNPLVDGSTPDLLVDDADSALVTITGNWMKETEGGYGPSLLLSAADGSVEFSTAITTSGNYAVYAYVPRRSGSSPRIPFIVSDGKNSNEVVINYSSVQVEGQTSGEWVSLGTYGLTAGDKANVMITTRKAGGVVAADAVLWVKQ